MKNGEYHTKQIAEVKRIHWHLLSGSEDGMIVLGGRVLDLACGAGANCYNLAEI